MTVPRKINGGTLRGRGEFRKCRKYAQFDFRRTLEETWKNKYLVSKAKQNVKLCGKLQLIVAFGDSYTKALKLQGAFYVEVQ